jgi:hypothetical protein
MFFHRGEKGQTTVELLTSASLLMITISGVGWLFKAEWQRGECAYFVFEKTHAALISSSSDSSGSLNSPLELLSSSSAVPVQIEDGPEQTRGFSFCRGTLESVTLPKLEVQN